MVRLGSIITLLALGALAMPAGAAASITRAQGPAAASGTVPGEIIVRYEPGSAASARSDARERSNVRTARALRLSRTHLVKVEEGTSVKEAIQRLERSGAVAYAEPNHRVRLLAEPNDPLFGQDLLWGLNNDASGAAFFGGTVDSDIDAPEAWDVATGSSDVVVAVVDTGVQYRHPDLQRQVIAGRDFVDGDDDPMDEEGHGTHVAGTIGATGNNGIGIAGVAWDTRIMPLRVLGADGTGDTAHVVDAFDYAGDNGAHIVNASLGSPRPTSQAENDVIARHPDVLFVFAAGNDGVNIEEEDPDGAGPAQVGSAPCDSAQPNVICVAATDAGDRMTGFSNYGPTTVDLAAPGQHILSTADHRELFRETFEASTFSPQWTPGPWGLGRDELGGFAFTVTDGALTTAQAIDVTGGANCVLEFVSGVSPLSTGVLESSADGLDPWTNVRTLTPGSYTSYSVAVDGSKRYRFRFVNGPLENDGMALDDVAVRCDGIDPEISYTLLSGTSMATPHVAGAAAVLLAFDPELTPSQVRALLMDSGDPDAGLSGRTVSGRRLNLMNAISAARVPIAVTGTATEVTTSGARVSGSIDPNGVPTDYAFQYGLTTAYGSQSPILPAGDRTSPLPVSALLEGLSPGTTYHFRVVALRDGIGAPGADGTFTTGAAPPPPPPTPTPTDPVALMRSTAQARCSRRGRRAVCRFTATGALTARGTVRNRRNRIVGRFRGTAGRRIGIRVRGLRRGRYTFRIMFIDAEGNRAVVRKRVRIR